jgi:hypothetical protein
MTKDDALQCVILVLVIFILIIGITSLRDISALKTQQAKVETVETVERYISIQERARKNSSAYSLCDDDLQTFFRKNMDNCVELTFFDEWTKCEGKIFPDDVMRYTK